MEKMTPAQEEKLVYVLKLLKAASYDLCDAIEGGGMMSDAKTAVYDAYTAVQSDNVLPPDIKAALLAHTSASWNAITALKSTDERLGDSIFHIGESERYLKRLAQGAK